MHHFVTLLENSEKYNATGRNAAILPISAVCQSPNRGDVILNRTIPDELLGPEMATSQKLLLWDCVCIFNLTGGVGRYNCQGFTKKRCRDRKEQLWRSTAGIVRCSLGQHKKYSNFMFSRPVPCEWRNQHRRWGYVWWRLHAFNVRLVRNECEEATHFAQTFHVSAAKLQSQRCVGVLLHFYKQLVMKGQQHRWHLCLIPTQLPLRKEGSRVFQLFLRLVTHNIWKVQTVVVIWWLITVLPWWISCRASDYLTQSASSVPFKITRVEVAKDWY